MSADLPQPPVTSEDEAPRDISTLPLIFGTVAVMALAVVMSIAALVAADDDSAASTAAPTHVGLTEFAIDPTVVSVSAGGALHVSNDGTTVHNLAVAETDLATPDLDAGESAELDLSSLEPGSYEVMCLIPGHAEGGMKAALEVGEGAAIAADTTDHSGMDTPSDAMDYDKMTEDMLATMAAYPATTEGTGNPALGTDRGLC